MLNVDVTYKEGRYQVSQEYGNKMVVVCKISKSSSTQLERHFNCIILHAAHLTVHEQ